MGLRTSVDVIGRPVLVGRFQRQLQSMVTNNRRRLMPRQHPFEIGRKLLEDVRDDINSNLDGEF
jgi:hypothetical protein